ncbi:MAG TPA: bis-aminopropyl spermidine synthase family protein [Chloroflexia bacterium]|nr:bis-aminopropyl spermidine synthase family protein [Chloroflexia bacterium]
MANETAGPSGAVGGAQGALLNDLAARTRLREGAAGIEAVLRTIHRHGGLTGKDLARQTRLPVPVVTAVRRELEKAGLVQPGPYIRLSPQGLVLVEGAWGWVGQGFLCSLCQGRHVVAGSEWSGVLEQLETWFLANPTVDVTLDQSHCTPETNLRRVLYMQTQGALAGKAVLLLGDDDSVSLAIGLVGRLLSPQGGGHLARRLCVVDSDARILEHIRQAAAAADLTIETVEHNLRDPLPESLLGAFDTVATDPPYTPAGLDLFLSRAVSALAPEQGRQIFLSFGHRAPAEQAALQESLTGLGLAMVEVIPGFNEYQGAGILAGVSQMIHLLSTPASRPRVSGRYSGPLYTGEMNPTVRVYRCMGCGTKLRVGQGTDTAAPSVEALKAAGCPRCGSVLFLLESREGVGGHE